MPTKAHRRHWSQFSLRTFLLVTTLAGPWLAWEIRAYQLESHAADEIQAMGGTLSRSIGFGAPSYRVRTITLQGRHFGDSHVDRVASLGRKFTCLEGLALLNTSVTGKGLKRLHELKSLRVLNLAGSDIRDEHLPTIAQMHSVTALGLADTFVTDAGVTNFRSMPQLSELVLPGLQVPADGEPAWQFRLRCELLDSFRPSVTVSYATVCQLRKEMPRCSILQRQ